MKQPFISIIVPITREWALDGLFKCLDELDCDTKRTELILYVDTNNPKVIHRCEVYIRKCKVYTDARVICSNRPGPNEVRISARRDRIVEVHTELQKLISDDADYVLGFEDDTIFPADTIKKLLPKAMKPGVGFVEGVQVGRWAKYIGAWRVDDLVNPTKILTLPALLVEKEDNNRYMEKIDAGGFYCFMTDANLYRQAKFHWHDDCFGPDVCYGLDLRKQGFKNYINWALVCGHNDCGVMLYPDEKTEQVRYNRDSEGNWTLESKVK